ncbi:ferric iron uptake transcriptional regulator [Ignatzschineria larvae DSM 13226]|uniref:Ferric uptake regulation protein n=2 Tax=Ignatzschineria larvae TaxID=112009 RepID=A0ABZ3C360_9GAMM
MMSSTELKNAGLKVTLPRLKILDILAKASATPVCHLTAEEIYMQLSSSGEEVGLATVYRVLTQFEQAGLVRRHFFDGGQSMFEIDDGDQHDHIICINCGHIGEFSHAKIHEKQAQIAAELGYELTDARTILHGICAKCREK